MLEVLKKNLSSNTFNHCNKLYKTNVKKGNIYEIRHYREAKKNQIIYSYLVAIELSCNILFRDVPLDVYVILFYI
jgi:hypothetical protein